jgi:hypothetical protein
MSENIQKAIDEIKAKLNSPDAKIEVRTFTEVTGSYTDLPKRLASHLESGDVIACCQHTNTDTRRSA